MKNEIVNILLLMFAFGLFCLLQALVINGIKRSMEEGMILEGFAKWVKEKVGEYWSKPLVGCIRCMSSIYGALTYWPCVIWAFGFELWQMPVFVADVFILVVISRAIYFKT